MHRNIPRDRPTSISRRTGLANALTTLPVIDVSHSSRGQRAESQDVARKIRQACIDIGFFYITGHGFSDAELEGALERGRRFFALPLDTKLGLSAKTNPSNMGFIQTGGLYAQSEY